MEKLSIIKKYGKIYRHSEIPEPKVDSIRKDAAFVEDSIAKASGRYVASPPFIWQRSCPDRDKVMIFFSWLKGLEGIINYSPVIGVEEDIQVNDMVLLIRNTDAGRIGIVVEEELNSCSSNRSGTKKIAFIPYRGEYVACNSMFVKIEEMPACDNRSPVGERIRVRNQRTYLPKNSEPYIKKKSKESSNWRELNFIYADDMVLNTKSSDLRYVYDCNRQDFKSVKSCDISLVSTYKQIVDTAFINNIVREAIMPYETWMKRIIERDNIERKVGKSAICNDERKMIECLLRN